MAMRAFVVALAVLCLYLGYRVHVLEADLLQVQRNAAIAMLSAESAHKKIGAFAPYFEQDKEAFVSAWLDETNLPQPVFPEGVLVPLQLELNARRNDEAASKLRAAIFK